MGWPIRVVRIVIALELAATLAAFCVRIDWAPLGVLLGLAATGPSLVMAWRQARGTPLRLVVAWAAAAVLLAIVTQLVAGTETLASGRPVAGHWAYLTSLATLAALLSVLNARRPGAGAWAFLMALLAIVLLIPWLEGGWANPWARLRLESPWTLFYVLLAFAGVANYLPTRFGPAAVVLGVDLAIEYLALTRPNWPLGRRATIWSLCPFLLPVSIWLAEGCARRPRRGRPGLERLWLWYRDHWGAVWALRMQQRFNRSAQLSSWPVRLGWFGLEPAPGAPSSLQPAVPDEAEQSFRALLRRFADPEVLAAAGGAAQACQSEGPGPS